MRLYEEGPKEQWRAELDRVNRDGLLIFIESCMSTLDILTGRMSRQSLVDGVRNAKKWGKHMSRSRSIDRFLEDPKSAIAETTRRRAAAKRGARRRKKGNR